MYVLAHNEVIWRFASATLFCFFFSCISAFSGIPKSLGGRYVYKTLKKKIFLRIPQCLQSL